jgi:hypothetical protein
MSYETRQEAASAVQDSVRTYTAAAAETALRLCARAYQVRGQCAADCGRTFGDVTQLETVGPQFHRNECTHSVRRNGRGCPMPTRGVGVHTARGLSAVSTSFVMLRLGALSWLSLHSRASNKPPAKHAAGVLGNTPVSRPANRAQNYSVTFPL